MKNKLEDNIERTFSDINYSTYFLDLSPEGKETKTMINKLDTYLILRGFPGSSVVKNPPREKQNPPSKQGKQVQSLVWEDHLLKELLINSSILAWEIQWTEEPGGYSPWGR